MLAFDVRMMAVLFRSFSHHAPVRRERVGRDVGRIPEADCYNEGMASAKCIYCGRFFNPQRGKGDHILAGALFGEFEGDERFRGVCSKCNNSFSPHEQILAQATPLGHLRGIVQPTRRGRQGGMRQRGAHGSKAPRFIAFAEDHGEIVQPHEDDPRNVSPVDRLTIQDQDGSEHYVRLFPGMSADRLKADIEKSGSKNQKQIFCSCDVPHLAFYKALLFELYPSHRWEDRPDTEAGIKRVQGRSEFEFSTDAFRGIAKIAFHYYLAYNRRGLRGSEPEFRAIRQFIQAKGSSEYEDFFDRTGPDFRPLGDMPAGMSPGSWCHVFGVHEVDKNIVVNMLLFAGPGFDGESHQLTLGEIRSNLIVPTGFWGHIYFYDPNRNDGFSGHVVEAPWRRLA